MAIQNRRGPYGDLDTRKLLPGEYAVVLQNDPFCKDGKAIYICFQPGDAKRVATFEDMQENIKDITDVIEQEFTDEIKVVTKNAKDFTAYMQQKLDNGEFIGARGPQGLVGPQGAGGAQGAKGPKGDTGERGDSGVVIPISGLFTLSGDGSGNLWAYYEEKSMPPQFEVDTDGNIYLVIADE